MPSRCSATSEVRTTVRRVVTIGGMTLAPARPTRAGAPGPVVPDLRHDAGRLREVAVGPDGHVTCTWDERGRLQTVTEAGCRTSYTYDGEVGRVATQHRTIDGLSFTVCFTTDGEPEALLLRDGTAVRYREITPPPSPGIRPPDLRLDGLANVVCSDGETFTYDADEQLVEAVHPERGAVRYRYDPAGNRVARSSPEGETTFSYDCRNRLTAYHAPDGSCVRLDWDANGNLIRKTSAGGVEDYEYDARRQLAVRRDGRLIARYRHDYLGHRIRREAGGRTTRYHHDLAGRLIAVTGEGGRLVVAFRHLGSRTVARLADGRTLVLHKDHRGSTERITGAEGAVVWRGIYSPFGRLLTDPPEFECPLFTGHLWDADSALYVCGVRCYDPTTGRFTTPDPVSHGPAEWTDRLRPPALNRYVYCRNNPLTYRDPHGCSVWGTIGKTALALIWSLPWTILGAALTVVNMVIGFPLGLLFLPRYGITGAASGRLGTAALVNIGGLGPPGPVLANIAFASRALVDDLDDTTKEYILPLELPRQLRTARTAFFDHVLSHTVQANFSGPFWPFVYLFASDFLERDATRDSGFPRQATPTLAVVPDRVVSRSDSKLIAVGGQRPYTATIDPRAGTVGPNPFVDQPRFGEASYQPQYVPGTYPITLKDSGGFTDTREVKVVELKIDFALRRPTHLFLDTISDPDQPTLRLVAQESATVELAAEPDDAAIVLGSAPTAGLILTGNRGVGDTYVGVTPVNAPAGPVPTELALRVLAWDAKGPELRRLRVRSLALITVELQAHVVRDGTHLSFEPGEITELVDRANEIWVQAGVRFRLRPTTEFIDEPKFRTITITCVPLGSTEDKEMFRWRPTALAPFPQGTNHNTVDCNAVHVYFVDDFDPANCVVAYAGSPSNYIVITKSRSITTLAHELGHCFGLDHPEDEAKNHKTPIPPNLGQRLMHTPALARGEPFLISNQETSRPFPGGDETLNARAQATTLITQKC